MPDYYHDHVHSRQYQNYHQHYNGLKVPEPLPDRHEAPQA